MGNTQIHEDESKPNKIVKSSPMPNIIECPKETLNLYLSGTYMRFAVVPVTEETQDKIYDLISDYVSPENILTESFIGCNKSMDIQQDKIVIHTNDQRSAAYSNVVTCALFQNTHSWQIQINNVDSRYGFKEPIIVGITKVFGLGKPREELRNFGMYGYDNFGRIYRNGICDETKKRKQLFGKNDLIIISYNGNKGTLQCCKYEKNNSPTWTKMNNIDCDSNYRLIISLHGKYDKVTVHYHECKLNKRKKSENFAYYARPMLNNHVQSISDKNKKNNEAADEDSKNYNYCNDKDQSSDSSHMVDTKYVVDIKDENEYVSNNKQVYVFVTDTDSKVSSMDKLSHEFVGAKKWNNIHLYTKCDQSGAMNANDILEKLNYSTLKETVSKPRISSVNVKKHQIIDTNEKSSIITAESNKKMRNQNKIRVLLNKIMKMKSYKLKIKAYPYVMQPHLIEFISEFVLKSIKAKYSQYNISIIKETKEDDEENKELNNMQNENDDQVMVECQVNDTDHRQQIYESPRAHIRFASCIGLLRILFDDPMNNPLEEITGTGTIIYVDDNN
eukprot:551916_1